MSPSSWLSEFGFWMVLTLKGRQKSFCFQTIKRHVTAETPAACQCRYVSVLVVQRKLLGAFTELLREIKYERLLQKTSVEPGEHPHSAQVSN